MRIGKILLCGLLLALPVLAEETEDRQTATSLHYVSHELVTRQNKLSAGTDKAITYTDTAGNVEQRTVKSDLTGGTTDTSLPMVNAVNAGLGTKQNDIATIDDHTAVTYTSQVGTIGQKGIYQTDGTYAEQSDNLIDAKTFNAALKNGLDSEFVCADRPDAHDPNTNLCWLWQIHNVTTGNTILPPEYTPLEYIEANGGQHINTGYGVGASTASDNGEFEFSLDIQFTNVDDRVVLGYAANSGLYWAANAGATKYTFSSSTDQYSLFDRHILNVKTVINVDSTRVISSTLKVIINGQTVSTGSDYRSNICSGGELRTTISPYQLYAKIYGLTQYKRGTKVFDGIPARRISDGKLGIYNKVNNTFRAGTGTFIAGPEQTNNIYIPQNQ